MRRITAFFVVCLLSATAPLRAQDPALEALSTESYLQLMDADALVAQGKSAEALVLYRKSLAGYEEIQRKDPAFKTRVVEYRLEDVRTKIKNLAGKTPAPSAATPAPSSPRPEEDFRSLYLELREKNLRDAARLLELERRNIEMTVALRERDDILSTLRSETQTQRRELDTIRGESNRNNAQLQKEVQDLRRFNNLLQERADKQEIELQDLRAERKKLAEDRLALAEDLQEWTYKAEQALAQLENVRTLSNQNAEQFRATEKELEEDLAESKTALDVALLRVSSLEKQLQELNTREEAARKQAETAVAASAEAAATAAAAETRAADAVKKATELQAALSESEKGFASRAAALKNELSDVQVAAADLKTALDTAQQNLKMEIGIRKTAQEAAAQQLQRYAEGLNEITLLRQMLRDRDQRLGELKARQDEELAALRAQINILKNPPPPPEADPVPVPETAAEEIPAP